MNDNSLPEEFLLLDNQLCFHLYATARRVIQLYTPHLSALDLTYTQYITLLVLWEHESLSVSKLGSHLLLDSGTLTPLLKNMEKKGLVTRRRSAEDERRVLVEVTPAGKALKEKALGFIPHLIGSLSMQPQEIVELRRLLARLLGDLEQSG